jgi:5'-3' exonuclease
MVEFEADDAVATAAARQRDAPGVEQVVICPPDKDLSQCVVASKVVCSDRRRRLDRDEAGVVERFGVPPAAIPDWLALVGDDADGIPGVPGWGEKSAAAVPTRYGSLETIPDDVARSDVSVRGGERLAASLSRPPRRGLSLSPARHAPHRRAARRRPRGPGPAGRRAEIETEELLGRVPRWREDQH